MKTYLNCMCEGCIRYRNEKGIPHPVSNRIEVSQDAIIVYNSAGDKAGINADGLYNLIVEYSKSKQHVQ